MLKKLIKWIKFWERITFEEAMGLIAIGLIAILIAIVVLIVKCIF